jgi:undecaprenyl pyrophosphate synthase
VITADDFCTRHTDGRHLMPASNEGTRDALVRGFRNMARDTKREAMTVLSMSITEEIKPNDFVVKRLVIEFIEKRPARKR